MTDPPLSENSAGGTLAAAVCLFNQREYFACHDVLEELWSETIGDDRDFLQGLLHVAVSLHHLSEGNPTGARKMYASSLRYLESSGSSRQGIDLDRLRAELAACFARSRSDVNPAAPHCDIDIFPQLHEGDAHV